MLDSELDQLDDGFLSSWSPQYKPIRFSVWLPFAVPAIVMLLAWFFQMPQPGAAILSVLSVCWGLGYIFLSLFRPGETLKQYGWLQWDKNENEKLKAEKAFINSLVDSGIITKATRVDAVSYEIEDSPPDLFVVNFDIQQSGMTYEHIRRQVERTAPALGAYSVDVERTGNTSFRIEYSFNDPIDKYRHDFIDDDEGDSSSDFRVAIHQPGSIPITLYSRKSIRAIIAGSSGSGKTVCLQKLLCEIARAGVDHQCVILDPKRVGFLDFTRRFDVIANPDMFTIALDAIYEEMMRRYEYMESHGLQSVPVEVFPLLYVVVDEVAELFDSAADKKDRDLRVKRLTQLCTLSRQANMSVILATQTPSTEVLPSTLRNQLDFRLVLRVFNRKQSELLAPDGMESGCLSHLLPEDIPGMGYFLTSNTGNRFVLGRVYQFDENDIRRTISKYAHDKVSAPWLAPASPLMPLSSMVRPNSPAAARLRGRPST